MEHNKAFFEMNLSVGIWIGWRRFTAKW